jgi:sec-independent protein translocase protein TatC
MAFADSRNPDPDDMFADTRMSFGDHIEELRRCLWRAIIGFGIIVTAVLVADGLGYVFDSLFNKWGDFGIGRPVMKYMQKPVEDALNEFYDARAEKIRQKLDKDAAAVEANTPTEFTQIALLRDSIQPKGPQPQDQRKPVSEKRMEALVKDLGEAEASQKYRVVTEDDLLRVWMRIEQPVDYESQLVRAQRQVGRRPLLSTLNVTEAMVVYFKVAIVCGIVLSSPWIFIQIWAFIAAGLYPHEKRYVNLYLPISLGLFLTGVAVCELLVLPRAVGALLWFNEWLDLEPELRLNEWLSFAIWLPIIFGLSFQTPLVMLFLERVGLLTVEGYKRGRKFAWFLMAILAAFITPTPDALTMILMWLPMCLLYELGIFMCWWSGPRKPFDVDVPEPEEMVEV